MPANAPRTADLPIATDGLSALKLPLPASAGASKQTLLGIQFIAAQRGAADSPPADEGHRVPLVVIGHALRQTIAHHFPRSRAERGDLPRYGRNSQAVIHRRQQGWGRQQQRN